MFSTAVLRYSLVACVTVVAILIHGTLAMAQPLRLVCDIWPPYQYENRGELTGFSVELVNEVYASMGITDQTMTAFPWKRAMEIVTHGRADALFSANYTVDRSVFGQYPDTPLFEAPWVLWTRRGIKLTSLDDIKGKKVGVVMGYSYTPEFWKFIETHCLVEKVSSDEVNFKKLEFGRIDVAIAEYGNGLYLQRRHELTEVQPQPNVEIKRDGLYIIFSKDTVEREFVDEFSTKLKQFKETDAYKALRAKYFGVE